MICKTFGAVIALTKALNKDFLLDYIRVLINDPVFLNMGIPNKEITLSMYTESGKISVEIWPYLSPVLTKKRIMIRLTYCVDGVEKTDEGVLFPCSFNWVKITKNSY